MMSVRFRMLNETNSCAEHLIEICARQQTTAVASNVAKEAQPTCLSWTRNAPEIFISDDGPRALILRYQTSTSAFLWSSSSPSGPAILGN